MAAVILAPLGGCQKQAPTDQTNSTPPQEPARISRAAAPPETSQAGPPPQRSVAVAPPKSSAATPPPQIAAPEPAVTSPEAALQKLERNSGLALSSGCKVLTYSDGGVPDPSIGFYEWAVLSPIHLALPGGRQLGDKEVLNLSLAEAVQIVESKMGGAKVENPQTAFSLGWQKNGFAFSGTWVRGQGADYLIVQQTRTQ